MTRERWVYFLCSHGGWSTQCFLLSSFEFLFSFEEVLKYSMCNFEISLQRWRVLTLLTLSSSLSSSRCFSFSLLFFYFSPQLYKLGQTMLFMMSTPLKATARFSNQSRLLFIAKRVFALIYHLISQIVFLVLLKEVFDSLHASTLRRSGQCPCLVVFNDIQH